MYPPGIATSPLFPQRRLEKRIGHGLFFGGVFDQPACAVEPEGGVAPETLFKARYLLAEVVRQMHGDLHRHRARRPGMNLLLGERGIERRVHAEKLAEAPEQLCGEEVYVFEEAHEDLLFGVERSPVLEGPQVVRQFPRAVALDPLEQLLFGDGLGGSFLHLVEAHNGLRPDALYGVAHEEDYLRLRHELMDVSDPVSVENRVSRGDLARHLPLLRLEHRGVPPVVVGQHVVLEVPQEILEGGLLYQVHRGPVFDLPTPLIVALALAEEPRQGVGAVVDLPVEVVDLFSGHEDLGVGLEVAVQPRRARLLSPYSDEVRKHPCPPGIFKSLSGELLARRNWTMIESGAGLVKFYIGPPRDVSRGREPGWSRSRRSVNRSMNSPNRSLSCVRVCSPAVSYPLLRSRSMS